jgi:hypothetical protein
VEVGEGAQAERAHPTERGEEGQMRNISTDSLLPRLPSPPLVYLSLPLPNISYSSQDSPSPALRIPEELLDKKQLEPRAAPTSTPGNQDDMDALLPPPEQTEEAEIQKGTNESPSPGDGKEEKEEKEEKERGKEERKEKKATNLWDNVDVLALRAILSDKTREHIAKSCYTKEHLDVWNETCGGAGFMEINMLSYLKDEKAPEWFASKNEAVRREYSFTEEQEIAFRKLLDEELEEEIVAQVPHTYPRFLNPVLMVPKKGGKWRKVVDCRIVNGQQVFIHFRMDGPEVVQVIALSGELATSLDIKSAFNHMRVSPEFRSQPTSVYESIVLSADLHSGALGSADRG